MWIPRAIARESGRSKMSLGVRWLERYRAVNAGAVVHEFGPGTDTCAGSEVDVGRPDQGDPAWCAAKRANQPGHADQAVVSGHAMGSAPLARGSTERLSDGR